MSLTDMADVDEDRPLVPAQEAENDDADEGLQDFRFLSTFSNSVILDPNQKLPKRGDKDFEANPTKLQASTLEASRQAMHDALSHTRFHTPKSHLLARYDPDTNGAWVERQKGTLLNTIGVWKKQKTAQSHASVGLEDAENDGGGQTKQRVSGALWLHPEEALYLLERGSLDIRWPNREAEHSDTREDEAAADVSLPMSLQGAYAAFLGPDKPCALTLEEYTVYASLKRAGYNVIRPDANNFVFTPESMALPSSSAESIPVMPWYLALWQRLARPQPVHPVTRLQLGPLVTPGLYRDYGDIYRLLSVVPFHNPTTSACMFEPKEPIETISTSSLEQLTCSYPDQTRLLEDETPRLEITYHVYKSATAYSKRSPPAPDFQLVVLSARNTVLPTLAQIDDLMARMPYEPPKATQQQQVYARLKYGYRNVLLAIVDEGMTSYLRLSDAGFGNEKIYDMARGRGGKLGGGGGRGGRGGRGKGRGRGRGRGG